MTIRKFSTARDILRFEGRDRKGYWQRFCMLLTLSVVIATMGLLRNSGAVVIAAMLIAPLMSPILGIAASLVVGRIGRALELLVIVVVAAIASVALAWVLVSVSDMPRGILIPDQVMARTDPGVEDLIVALAAGIAAAYVQIQKSEISLLPGAAIGVSLVPPLSAAGVLLYFGEMRDAYDASLLFTTNLGAIILSACGVYVFSAKRADVKRAGKRVAKFSFGVGVTMFLMALVIAQLGSATFERYRENRAEAALADGILNWADPVSVEIIRVEVKPSRKLAEVWLIVDLPKEAQYRVASIADLLPASLKEDPLRDLVREVLGPEYTVALRYQTRIAGLVVLASDEILPAPSAGVRK